METFFSLNRTSSTLAAVFADVSMKINPCSRANASPSSFCTSRRAKRSLNKKKTFHSSSHSTTLSLSRLPFIAN